MTKSQEMPDYIQSISRKEKKNKTLKFGSQTKTSAKVRLIN